MLERDELLWRLDSLMLEAEEEDSVLAVTWLFALTWGRGGFGLVFLAGTIGSFEFPRCCIADELARLRVFWVANLAVLVPA